MTFISSDPTKANPPSNRKAAKVLASFVKPNQIFGQDQVIPPDVLQRAKGLAIITVLKAGFLFSGRAGSGVIVARLSDGSWSPPSAIATAGAGAGGQIGFELTDFVFILNTQEAVNSFAQAGSITLGGNISVAAGPLGRNAEAGGTASLKSAAAIFAYSKTKGLFAGVSLEGSAIIERREANRKFYGNNCKARQILAGRVDAPRECDILFRVLESRAFTKRRAGDYYDDEDFYDDIPSINTNSDASTLDGGSARATSRSYQRGSRSRHSDESDDDLNTSRRPRLATGASRASKPSSWEDDVYDNYDRRSSTRAAHHSDGDDDVDALERRFRKSNIDDKPAYSRDTKPSASSRGPKAIALFSFEGEQSGDLPFRKGDVVTIVKKSDSQDDWWTGRVNGKEGIFPANYVELA